MKTPRLLGWLSLFCLFVTLVWLVLMIAGTASAGPLDTFELMLAHIAQQGALFYLTYLNAALIPLSATLWSVALYLHCKPAAPEWSALALILVPVYCVLNLFAYLSQITLVPALLSLRQSPEYQATAEALLRLAIQQWPGSTVGFFNNLAYAILGIPSIIFGLILLKEGGLKRLAGLLLALNGVACIAGVVGILMNNKLLSNGSVVGGVLFLLALIPMAWAFLREN
jgi:hypothetical protein